MDKPNLFFVYGTLMKGFCNSCFLDRFGGIHQPATANGVMYGYGVPICDFKTKKNATIIGELVTVPEENLTAALQQVDRLEGYDESEQKGYGGYRRILIDVTLADGTVVKAWAYSTWECKDDGYTSAIASGDWKEHLKAQELEDRYRYDGKKIFRR